MIIGSKQNLSHIKKTSSLNPSFNLGNDDIGFVNETKYLGIMIDDNLKWDSQIKNIQTKISRALSLLKYAKRYVPTSTLNNLYKGIMEPYLNYCCAHRNTRTRTRTLLFSGQSSGACMGRQYGC